MLGRLEPSVEVRREQTDHSARKLIDHVNVLLGHFDFCVLVVCFRYNGKAAVPQSNDWGNVRNDLLHIEVGQVR